MNLYFFYLAIGAYLLAAAGYLVFMLKPEKAGTASLSLRITLAGFIAHLIYFALRWFESDMIPITSFFESTNFLGMGIILVFLIMEFRFKIAALGSFMLPLVIVLMLPAIIVSPEIKAASPMLKSGWLGIHAGLTLLGDAAFAFAFIVSIMYLLQERQLKAKHLGAAFHRLPSLDIMDTLAYRSTTFGWPLFTFGMITGAIWANSVWGSYWSWDAKQIWSLLTWIIYLILLHLRMIGWRGRKMAVLSTLAFLFVLISFFVIERGAVGRHSF